MFTNVSLKAQITWLSASLIFITTLVLTTNYWLRTASFFEQQLQQQMHFAQNVLKQNLKQKEQVLSTSASVLAADFGFKQAVATQDTNTIQSVLLNHSRRIDADLMVLTDINGQFIASSDSARYSSIKTKSYFSEFLLNKIQAKIVAIENNVYQVIVVPVKAPRTIGYAIIGFQFDQQALIKLKELLSLDITFVKQGQVIRSSLDNETLNSESINIIDKKNDDVSLLFSFGLYFHQSLAIVSSDDIKVVLSASLKTLHNDFKQLMLATILAALIVLFIAISSSRLMSNRVTNPLQNLMALTRDISSGNFNVPKIKHNFPIELNKLYQSFGVMGKAIEQRENQITYQAERDLLTGLFNRHKILTEVQSLLSINTNIALINFNVKSFKALNDTFGINNGDSILQEIANRLNSLKNKFEPESTVLSSRTHADDFLVAISIESISQLTGIIELLRSALEHPYLLDEITLKVPFYYGIANSIEHGQDAEKLIRRATMTASNAVKTRHTFLYYQDGEDEAYLYKLNLIEELKQALEQESSPLFLNYQPKLNLITGSIDKSEALIRWINKQGEFVNPELFVALAEQSGLIVSLTHWIINEVAKQINQWNQLGYRFSVSINLSAQDIQHQDFVNYLVDTVAKHDVQPAQVILELTERDIADNETLILSKLNHLKTLGFEVSVDDYGIGQSSLAKLKNLPVDELKIDKCFILTLDKSQQDQDIVSSTIELGHKLGLRVIAEGVENQASLALLKQFGCDYIQGYHISRPLKADQLIQWYNTYVSTN